MNYFSSTVINANGSKELFSVLNGLLGSNSNSPLPTSYEMSQLPNTFSSFFTSKIQKLRQKLDASPFQDCQPDPKFSGIPFESFSPVSQTDIEKVIKEMSLKSCELDPIPASVFTQCLPHLLPFITDIVNTSLTTGVFPTDHK